MTVHWLRKRHFLPVANSKSKKVIKIFEVAIKRNLSDMTVESQSLFRCCFN
ncbi:hypothetical protein EC07798_3299 [Escherichia coli 07798]|nr:hypothetical protein EC07798_3299 [Escherichia coli 07798]VEW01984.1 conserved hypothetical protein [Escherichia coli]